MGKLIEFSIAFTDVPHAVYFPGQAITGVVTANLNDSMKMRALKLNFKGAANVHWSERHGSGKNRRTRHYRASETYFDVTVSLIGAGSGGATENDSQILPGRNVYPFTFNLPTNLPTSFEGAHGYVRYFLKATIDKPWKFNHNTKVAFTVLSPLDLNQVPTAKNQVTANNSKTLCCLCCASGPIQAQLHLARCGYVPGEFVLINASVENLSTTDMPSTRAELVQTVKFHARTKTRSSEKIVASVAGQGCRPRQSISWNNERLQIPPLPTSMLHFCNIIDIVYTIRFVVVVPSGSFNLKTPAPITIGSVPLTDLTPYVHNISPPPIVETTAPLSVPSAPAEPNFSQPFQPPPPSYAAAVGDSVNIKGEDDNDHLMGQTTFAPKYAYYDWNQTAFSYS